MSNNDTSKKVLILLSDIDSVFSRVCKTKFSNIPNWEAVITSSLEEAIQTIQTEKPNLILTDIILNGGDGFELLTSVRNDKDAHIHNVPVIFLTDLSQESDIQKAKELGVTDYLVKTEISLNTVIEKLQKYIA